MQGRKYSQASAKYRYGFNGKENDNDVKAEGNQQDYGMRIYDPRLGRFLSVDPLTKDYPELTPYQFASNTPIWAIDIDGLEGGLYSAGTNLNTAEKMHSGQGAALANWWNSPASPSQKQSLANRVSYSQVGYSPDVFYNEKLTKGEYFMQSFGMSALTYTQSNPGNLKIPNTRQPQKPQAEVEINVSSTKLKNASQTTPVQQAQAKASGTNVKLQGAGGMFGGNQWLNKGIHANVEGIGQNVEIGFKLNAAGDDLSVSIVNYKGKLSENQKESVIQLGQKFLQDKDNLQKLKGWFEAAKGNSSVPSTDHGKIDKTIEVLNKKTE